MSSKEEFIIKPGQAIEIRTDDSSLLTASCTSQDGELVLTLTSTHKTDDPINGKNTYSSTAILQKGTIFQINYPDVTIRIGEPWEQSG